MLEAPCVCRHSCADTCLMMWCYTYICRHAWSVSTELPYIHCDTHTYVRRHTHSYTTPAYNYAFLLFYILILLLFHCLCKCCFWMFACLVMSLALVSSVVQGSAVNGSIAYNASTGEVSGWTLLKGTHNVWWCMV